MRRRLPLLVVLVATALDWARLTGAGLLWDDRGLVANNTALSAPTWAGVFGSDLWAGTGMAPTAYYRPLLTVSLLLDRWVFGGSVALAHLQSVVWHLGVVAVVYGLVERRAGAARAAVAGLMFGLHPIQCEAVGWLAARNDLMVAAFVLAAIAAAERDRPVLTALLAVGAALSKETGFLAPAVYLGWAFAWGERPRTRTLAALLGGVVAALALRAGASLGTIEAGRRTPPDHPFGLVYAAIGWVGWFTLPWPLTSTRTVYPVPPWTSWVGAAASLAGAATLVRASPRRALGLLGLAGFTLAPAGVTVAVTQMLGERYVYLPSAFVAIAVALVLPDRVGVRVVGGVVAVLAVVAVQLHLGDFHDEVRYFTAAAARTDDGFADYLAADAWARAGRQDEAYAAAERSVAAPVHLHFACPMAAGSGARVLAPAEWWARVQDWDAVGCRTFPGYDDTVLAALAVFDRWDLVAARLPDQVARDLTLRSVGVRGASFLLDGNWTALMLASTRHPDGAADYLDLAYGWAEAGP